jgi:MinD-like ATPase involved in chromosome partitioning or flagellar assembly
LPNRVSSEQEAAYISENFNSITEKYLTATISSRGFIPEDDIFRQAVAAQMPVAQVDRQTTVITNLNALADELIKHVNGSFEINKNTTEKGIKEIPATADIRR